MLTAQKISKVLPEGNSNRRRWISPQYLRSPEDGGIVTKIKEGKKGKAVSGYPEIKKDQVLGRVYTVHPGNAECYYLRLLLHKIPGPTSFTAIKIVTGVVQPSFQAACKALGLLEKDAHWSRKLEEASIPESSNKIRELFAIILVFCQVGDQMKLWEKRLDSLSEDVKKQIEAQQGNIDLYLDIVYNQCLILLEDIVISRSGKALLQFGFLSPSREARSAISNHQRERNIAIAVAFSGIAAILIDGGKTAHSAFKLPLNLHHSESVNYNISKQSDMAPVLREAKLIIWDECTVTHKKGIEALNRTLQDIRGCNQIMGGLTILLSCDFRQTLYVVLRGTREDIVKACLNTSFLWPHIKVVFLRINMRVHP
ncbi:ATP-dependent DNA helicase [Trichonephila clavipes]|nr:ATP-dependent DNA helicase [Trichonephila clavipes]